MTRDEEESAVLAWIAANTVKRMPRRSATAPPILAIRASLKQGKDIEFKRGRSGRTVTFKAASAGGEKIVHDEGMHHRRRRKAVGTRNNRQR